MSLAKNYQYVYHPAVAEVPYRAAYTVCQQQTTGYWMTTWSSQDATKSFLAGAAFAYRSNTYLLITYSDGKVLKKYQVGTSVATEVVTAGTGDPSASVVSALYYTSASVWVDTTNSSNVVCTTYPEQPHVPAQAAYVETVPVAEWNAGANSLDTQDGDCQVTFNMGLVVGVIVGLTTDTSNVADYTRLSHALYFHQDASGRPVFNVLESGRTARAAEAYSTSDTWAIRRVGTMVSYFRNGQRVMVSQVPSSGTLSVGTALYYSGDSIA